jgi:hypothetical protein
VRDAIADAFFQDVPDQVLPGANMGPRLDRMAEAAVDALGLTELWAVRVVRAAFPD